MKTRILVVLAVAAAMACGSSSTGPKPAGVAGLWSLVANDLTGTANCSAAINMILTQEGTILAGTPYVGGVQVTCSPDASKMFGCGADTANSVRGTVHGQTMDFNFGNGCAVGTGTVSAETVGGVPISNAFVSGTIKIISTQGDTVSGHFDGTKY